MLRIRQKLIEQILEHSRKAYPCECCGLLAGTATEVKTVEAVFPLTNMNKERSADRYEINPEEYEARDQEIQESGWQVIGIYHSHPDHPPCPSETDLKKAWPVYSYLIVMVENGESVDWRSWVLSEDETQFQEESFDLKDENSSYQFS